MKKLFFSSGFLIILFLVIILFGYQFYRNYQQIVLLRQEIGQLEQQIETTSRKKGQLLQELENVNNLEYIEEIARRRLGLIKPGEILLIPVIEDGDSIFP